MTFMPDSTDLDGLRVPVVVSSEAALDAMVAEQMAACTELVQSLADLTWVLSRVDESVTLETGRGRIISLLDGSGGRSITVLADWAGISASVAARLVASLERDGLLVRRGCDDDRRKVIAVLTALGQATLASTRAARADRLHRLLMRADAAASETITPMTELLDRLRVIADVLSRWDDSMLRRSRPSRHDEPGCW